MQMEHEKCLEIIVHYNGQLEPILVDRRMDGLTDRWLDGRLEGLLNRSTKPLRQSRVRDKSFVTQPRKRTGDRQNRIAPEVVHLRSNGLARGQT